MKKINPKRVKSQRADVAQPPKSSVKATAKPKALQEAEPKLDWRKKAKQFAKTYGW